MSSHHFVKEGQEPALVIVDPLACSFELIGQLIEWCPKVMLLERALEEVLKWNIKIDAVICPQTHQEALSALLEHQMPIEFLLLDDQSELFFFLNDYAKNNHFNEFYLICDSESYFLSEKCTSICFVFYSGLFKSYFVESGNWKKWLNEKDEIILTSKEGLNDMLVAENLTIIEKSSVKIRFKVIQPGICSINTAGKNFWISEVVSVLD